MGSEFSEYLTHGWKLCRIEPGTKGSRTTGWNLLENAVKDASNLQGAGLLHAYSGTCALDLDRLDEAAVFLKDRGIDLNALLNAPDVVQIISGQPNRGKLLYTLETPLPSKSFHKGAFELRCGTASGFSAQDVLPPSQHPGGTVYTWKGDFRSLPTIPPAILALWVDANGVVRPSPLLSDKKLGEAFPELKALLSRRDASCGYSEWIEIGMALNHETGGSSEGLAIWDEFSAVSEKYPGLETLQSHWRSFGRSSTPITVDSLRRADRALASDFDDLTAAAVWGEDRVDEKPQAVHGFEFLSLLELFKRPQPNWIIEGLLPEAAIGAIYGQPSAGKTFAACDIALSIALGQPWRGRAVKQGRILYIAAEDDRGVQMRLEAGLGARGVSDANLRVLPTAPVLTNKDHKIRLLEALKREDRPTIVFFDTLAAVTPGADENASKDMGELVSYCYQIHKATGALVMLIHHEGKTPGKGMRGSSSLLGASDVVWEVSKDEMEHELRVDKLKNWQCGDAYKFRLLPVANSCVVDWL